MKKFLQPLVLLLMALMLPTIAFAANGQLGDVNNDGNVVISDVTNLIDYLLGDNVSSFSVANADVNSDGAVSIKDVTTLIDNLLNSTSSQDEPVPQTETFVVNGVSFKMIAVEGGTFMMGESEERDSDAYSDEAPIHQVTLSSYCIGEKQVTQTLWEAVMGNNPSLYTGKSSRPVERVSWEDCQTFIAKLNEFTGRQFRLPTEAEWEYAARGGNKSQSYRYAGGNDIDDVAWYRINSSDMYNGRFYVGTFPVGTMQANELGLYDMSGNVWEWCQDWYGAYSNNAQRNPKGPSEGSYRVCRGGSWFSYENDCRVSCRNNATPTLTSNCIGLRLAL